MKARELNKAIAAHGVWKVRLHEAITSGTSEYRPESVALDTACEFGKWFYAIPVAERPAELWGKVQRLHALFHKEAGRILEFALEGNPEEALALMTDLGGVFVSTSIELSNTLYAWKQQVLEETDRVALVPACETA
ncbi:CZB domain-containing protein [Geobacter argillaceus]|uniref:Chemoreceptor zinc-binding protein n=1 Tax=Geobacter argillaceus TaxID=345631 RepID=A0A562VEZ9_9BACT|nr:CZB domain-containing protein [Geobacter argillaceus]TWJ16460.1 chemoreceptor zinc-binding protein [Geobacter argillaceus]